MKTIELGISHTLEITLTDAHSAINVGSGDVNVFGTPAMIALMENASINLMHEYFDEGETSVGIQLEVFHTRATPIGEEVRITAKLTNVEEGRKLSFELLAEDAKGAIGHGTLQRAVINKERFMAKLAK